MLSVRGDSYYSNIWIPQEVYISTRKEAILYKKFLNNEILSQEAVGNGHI